MDGAVAIRTKSIVTGEVDDISRYRHSERGRKASPERCGSFISGDFPKTIKCRVERLTSCLVSSTVGGLSRV